MQSIPYCRRTNHSVPLNRSNGADIRCYNNGTWIVFTTLRDNNIKTEQVLRQSSGVDVADAYAAFLDSDRFVVTCL